MWVVDGEKVKAIRTARGMSQTKLAHHAKVKSEPGVISKIERAPRGTKSEIDFVKRLAQGLCVSMERIITDI